MTGRLANINSGLCFHATSRTPDFETKSIKKLPTIASPQLTTPDFSPQAVGGGALLTGTATC
jgi:hypothetical protein